MASIEPIPFASQAWLDQFRVALEASSEFCAATSDWNDDSVFVIDVDPVVGWTTPVAFYMAWKAGRLVEAEVIDDVSRIAVFRVSGVYSAWADGHHSRMDAGVAFLTGKFQFSGPFAKAAVNLSGNLLLLKTAFEVPTQFLSKEEEQRVSR